MIVDVLNPVNKSHPLNRGLVSWWLNLPGGVWRGGSTARDLMRRNDADLIGNSAWVGDQGRRNGFGWWDFDGSGDGIPTGTNVLNRLTLPNPWSLSFWGVTQAAGAFRTGCCFDRSGPSELIGIGQDNSTPPKFKIASEGETPGTGSALTVGKVYHFSLTWDGTQFHGYLNGNLDYSVTPIGSGWQSCTDFGIGVNPVSGSVAGWNGLIDDVRLFDREIRASELKALCQESAAGNRNTLNWIRSSSYRVPVATGFPFRRYYQVGSL